LSDIVNTIKKLSEEFHYSVKLQWNTIDDIILLGNEWVLQVSTDRDPDVIEFAKELVAAEARHFVISAGLAKQIPIPPSLLIMKGGGIKGLAYVGALEEIQKFYSFNWYAGTSAGAIAAVLLSSGHTTDELNSILSTKNFKEFMDANILSAIRNLITKSGLYPANAFTSWLNDLLAEKLESPTEVLLGELPHRTTVYACKRDQTVIFDSGNPKNKETPAAFAARCSMSIPYIFIPQQIDGLNVFDGGMQNNFPVEKILKIEPKADWVGFYLGDKRFKWKRNNSFFDLFRVWMESNDPEILRNYKDRIVVIDPSPIGVLNFKLSENQKKFLLESGRLAALEFLHKRELIDKSKSEYNYSDRVTANDKLRERLNTKNQRRNRIIFASISILVVVMFFFTEIYSFLFKFKEMFVHLFNLTR